METYNKDLLRRRYKSLREDLGASVREEIDRKISSHVLKLPEWSEAKTVYTYLSVGSEVDTRAIIQHAWAEGKAVALPRCVPGTRAMRWFVIRSLEGLERSGYGVYEPIPGTHKEVDGHGDDLALALVPGLAFDADGYRLGYGGGFYDAFLAGFAGTSVGLCRRASICGRTLGIEAHDRPVHIVITENGVGRVAS